MLKRVLTQPLAIRLGIGGALFVACAVLFFELADAVLEGEWLAREEAFLQYLYANATPALDSFFLFVTNFGGVVFVTLFTIAMTGLLYRFRSKQWSLFVVVGVAGASLSNALLKLFFERARPDLWQQLINEETFSFPSGHSVASAAIATSLVIILWKTRWRTLTIILASLYMLLVGFSRLYLGVHYPTDVVGGWVFGVAWVLLTAAVMFGPRLYHMLLLKMSNK